MSQISNLNQTKKNQTTGKYIHRKRESVKPLTPKASVYVNNKSNFKCNLEKIEKLWTKGESEITVRALGRAISRAINLCLQFQRNHHHVVDFDITTNTVNLVDDLEPLTEDDDFKIVARYNSSICIKLVRRIPLNSE